MGIQQPACMRVCRSYKEGPVAMSLAPTARNAEVLRGCPAGIRGPDRQPRKRFERDEPVLVYGGEPERFRGPVVLSLLR